MNMKEYKTKGKTPFLNQIKIQKMGVCDQFINQSKINKQVHIAYEISCIELAIELVCILGQG